MGVLGREKLAALLENMSFIAGRSISSRQTPHSMEQNKNQIKNSAESSHPLTLGRVTCSWSVAIR